VFQGIEVRERAFVSKTVREDKFEIVSVEVDLSIQEMGLDTHYLVGRVDGRAASDVDNRVRGLTGPEGPGRVDARRRQCQPGDIEIRGRKTEPAGTSVTDDHASAHCVAPPQHAVDCVEIAVADGLADAGAAYGLTVLKAGGQCAGDKTETSFELAEQGDGAGASIPEVEVLADVNAGQAPEALDKQGDEFLAGQAAEGSIEFDHPRSVEGQVFEGPETLSEGLDEAGRAFGVDDGKRMAIERDGDGRCAEFISVLLEVLEDGLVAKVDAIEHTDGDADRLCGSYELGELAGDFHAKTLIPRRRV